LSIIRYFGNLRNMDLVFKALADPTRRQVLQLLKNGPMKAGEIAEHVSVAKPTLSDHLAVLRQAELVSSEKNGTSITYWLNASVLEGALLAFADMVDIGLSRDKPRTSRARN
jgi:DNA-binding transcriptional ArsR family regulator